MTDALGATTTAMDVVKGRDLTGRRALVTGGYAGLGYETARALASAGAEVVIAGRDAHKLKAAVASLSEATGNPHIHGMLLDLANLASVRQFASDFQARFPKLKYLINNAGVMACPLSRTADGFEMQFGTNHLGHFLLSGLLLPVLKAGQPGRIVFLSSGGHKYSPINFDDLNFEHTEYDKWKAYGQSKTANALCALGFDRRYRDQGIRSFAVHPGVIFTDLARHLTEEDFNAFESKDGKEGQRGKLVIKTVEQGAATSVWAAIAKELRGEGGLYLEDCHVAEQVEEGVQSHGYYEYAMNPRQSDRLWRFSERLVGWKS